MEEMSTMDTNWTSPEDTDLGTSEPTGTVVEHPAPSATGSDVRIHRSENEPRQSRSPWLATLLVVSLAAALVVGVAIGRDLEASEVADAESVESTSVDAVATSDSAEAAVLVSGSSGLADASAVADTVVPSVVTVEVSATFRNQTVAVATGSGVIYDEGGSIITNAHVVEEGSSFSVVLSDGRVYPAELVGYDTTTDLAVLDIDASDLTPIALGSSDALDVGDPTIAVGSPLGLDGGPSVSAGILSATGRTVEIDSETTLVGMLQSDAPITQGSSGGALVDEAGGLIGITSAVGVSEVGIEGIGFSTPVEIVERVVEDILETGSATQPLLGIMGATALDDTGDGGQVNVGVQVESITTNSAAETAGLEPGDIVTAVDGESVETMEELVALLRRHSVGDEMTLSVLSADATSTITLILGTR